MITAQALILDYHHVAIASVLIGIVLALSWLLKLGIGKQILIASVRTVIQLSFIGLILAWIFARSQWYEVLTILTIMTLIASISASNRVKQPYRGLRFDSLVAVMGSAWLVALVGVMLIFGNQPWYEPSIIIPVMGLILGNSLTAVSLCMSQLVASFHREQAMLQMQLSLAATPWEASQTLIKSAINNGIMPTINSMMVVGVVSLPGMMTGQILAGADPHQAVLYQIITMFLIAGSSTLVCVLACLLVYRRFFNGYQQLVIPPSAMPFKLRFLKNPSVPVKTFNRNNMG